MKHTPVLIVSVALLTACGSKDDPAATTAATATTLATDGTSSTSGDDTSGGTTDPTSGGTTAATSGGSTTGTFLQEPDGGQGSIECDIWAQDCNEGDKCMPWANDGGSSWNATKCSPLDANPKQVGDACTVEGNGVSGVDDCDIATMCWDVDPETNMGVCVSFCQGSEADPSCADPNTACTIYNDGVLPLCLPTCDPLLQDCANMNVCVSTAGGEGFVCVLDASGDMGVAGDPCEYVNVCDPGLFCADAAAVPNCQGSIGCCSEFCDLSLPDPNAACTCAAGGCECVPWFEMSPPPGLEDVGGCVIPQ